MTRIKSAKWDFANSERDRMAKEGLEATIAVARMDVPLWRQRVLDCLAACEMPGWRAFLESCLRWLERGVDLAPNRRRNIAMYERATAVAKKTGKFTLRDINWELRVERAKQHAAERQSKRPAWMSDPSLLPKKPPRAPI